MSAALTSSGAVPVATTGKAIRIDGVGKVYGEDTATPFQALLPTTIDIKPGEFVSVVGPSGCGKSTLMLMVAGLLAASHGTISIGGKKLSGALTDVGIAFQDHLLLEFRTAEDNVLLQGVIRKLPMQPIKERTAELFDRLGLTRAAQRYPNQLSGGMRQRVSLARALAVDPELVFLDESFSQLDHVTSKVLRQDFHRIATELHKTCLLVTHRIDDALEMADRVLVLSAPAQVCLELAIGADARRDPARLATIHDRIAAAMGGEDQPISAAGDTL